MRSTLTKKAHDPIKVDKVEAYWIASLVPPNPTAPHAVKPRAPIKFQKPMCQPSTFGAGSHHFFCVSSMKSRLDTMKPVPPITCDACKNQLRPCRTQ